MSVPVSPPRAASLPSSVPSDAQELSRLLGDTDGLSVWPRSTRLEADGDVSVGGVS